MKILVLVLKILWEWTLRVPSLNSLRTGGFWWKFRWILLKPITMIDGWDIFCEITLRRMSLDLTDDKSTLVQVMAWCRQATSHYLSWCWPRSLLPYNVTRPQRVNGLVLFVPFVFTVMKMVRVYKKDHLNTHIYIYIVSGVCMCHLTWRASPIMVMPRHENAFWKFPLQWTCHVNTEVLIDVGWLNCSKSSGGSCDLWRHATNLTSLIKRDIITFHHIHIMIHQSMMRRKLGSSSNGRSWKEEMLCPMQRVIWRMIKYGCRRNLRYVTLHEHGPLTRYAKLRVGHAPGMPGTFSPPPTSNETTSYRSQHASRHVRRARAVMHVGIDNPRRRGKRSRCSRRMRNPQFCVFGKRPMQETRLPTWN